MLVVRKTKIFCAAPGCGVRAAFNLERGMPPRFCTSHKAPCMVNVCARQCHHPGCVRQALYGSANTFSCPLHRPAGAQSFNRSTPCEATGCGVRNAMFNLPGQKRGRFCSLHKTDNMVHVTSSQCAEPGCLEFGRYHQPGRRQLRYCARHKQPSMARWQVCAAEGCSVIALWNYEGEQKGQFCTQHKTPDMIRLQPLKTCSQPGCERRPSFNFEGQRGGRFCHAHKQEGMTNVIQHKRCKFEGCGTRVSNARYEGYCWRCFVHLFPDRPVGRRFGTKERAVREFVLASFPDLGWICDQRLLDGCSRRRPDMALDLGHQVIIIEVDEQQHALYDATCENRRLMELSVDVAHRPLVTLRFNPDSYVSADGAHISTCWTVNRATGACRVKNEQAWRERLQTLRSRIEYWLSHKAEKTAHVETLFFDA